MRHFEPYARSIYLYYLKMSFCVDENHPETSIKVYTFNDNKWLRNKTVCRNLKQLEGLPTFKLLTMNSGYDPNRTIQVNKN